MYFKEMERLSSLSREEIEVRQWQKVEKALHNAYLHIPYYRRIFKETSLHPNDIKRPEDLTALPMLTKSTVQDEVNNFYNPNIKRYFRRSTSGSVGTPLQFHKDAVALGAMDAVMYHGYSWHGIKPGDPAARFWGLPFSGKARRLNLFKDILMNRVRLSAFEFSQGRVEDFVKRLKRFQPKYFYGYPSLIHEFTLFCIQRSIDPGFLKLKCIIGTGELVVAEQEKRIESFFNVPFVKEYGCTEIGVIGLDCPAGNMHLMLPGVYLEVIRDGQQVFNQDGEIVVTELNFKSFPFIRYRLNDIGRILTNGCQCGSNYPVIEITKGRIDSYIRTPNGHRVYDAVLAYTLKEGIRAFKAVQTALDRIDIHLIPDHCFNESLEAAYTRKLVELIDPEMKIFFHVCDKLPRESSGKLRYFVPFRPGNNGASHETTYL
jgi:phenylacetate-CoA ligase